MRSTLIASRQLDFLLKLFWWRSKRPIVFREEEDSSLEGTVTLYSWGIGNGDGQLGRDFLEPKSIPVLNRKGILGFSCGLLHSMAFTGDGKIWSWGSNDHMQLGNDTHDLFSDGEQMFPEKVKALSNQPKITQVACGFWHSMALTEFGSLFIWGNGFRGQVGAGNCYNYGDPIELLTFRRKVLSRISAGALHSCAITREGELFAWGCSAQGQLGISTSENQDSPKKVEYFEGMKVLDVKCGTFHTVVQTEKGELFSMGGGFSASFSRPSDPYSMSTERIPNFEPVKILSDSQRIRSIACGNNVTAIISDSGDLWLWECSHPFPRKIHPIGANQAKKYRKVSLCGPQIALLTEEMELFVSSLTELLNANYKDPKWIPLLKNKNVVDVVLSWEFGLCLVSH